MAVEGGGSFGDLDGTGVRVGIISTRYGGAYTITSMILFFSFQHLKGMCPACHVFHMLFACCQFNEIRSECVVCGSAFLCDILPEMMSAPTFSLSDDCKLHSFEYLTWPE